MRFPRFLVALFLAFAIGFAPVTLDAQKRVQVKGYTKKDGTYVPPHTRAAPGTKAKATSSAPPKTATSTRAKQPVVVGVSRDADGRIARNDTARRAFMKQTGYPNGRPGYVIDHVTALACGGADAPINMQWQTIAAAKAKDRVERVGC
jgi:hypothetical protein